MGHVRHELAVCPALLTHIAAVPLSGSLNLNQEKNLRNAFDIPEYENVIMFIGIGNYVDEYKVPKSDRRAVSYKFY
ncbi:MAG: hypothetical protein U5K84_06505 [Alkalibacterium sp.]|nr:hypothetical protein [Alkalibacterium sp.]